MHIISIKLVFLLNVIPMINIPSGLNTEKIDMTDVSVLISKSITSPVRETILKVLLEEIKSRTSIDWMQAVKWDAKNRTIIAIALSGDKELAGKVVPRRNVNDYPEYKSEGYRVYIEKTENKNIVWIIGANARATFFGAGYLLRNAILMNKQAYLEKPLDVASAPMQIIRGHQLGYRNTANSYDAWDVKQYERYIRELVLFGTNAVENIPFEDTNDSVHMPISRKEMNVRISEICASYDIDYWVWTPATFDLEDIEKRTEMLKAHEQFYKECPRLDHIFFPGGDPGNNHPRLVMPFLKDLSERLVKYHPSASVWISLQGFSEEQVDYFYQYLNENEPLWLKGVVSGPSSPSIAETRHRLLDRYKHRQYPDITHNVRCEFPALNLDQAYMLTIGREGINPRPNYYAKIHAAYAPFTDGFVTYSDGCHDDVNKVIWSMRGWNINYPVRDILIGYCRFFFGPEVAIRAAEGILALEKNWIGPIIENGSIETTFEYWKNLEAENPQLSENWRWKMLVLRAYYDTYQRRRKIYEWELEKKANVILAQASTLRADKAMEYALTTVNKADSEPVAQDIYGKIVQYCDDLFQSIGLQTSVSKYQASNSQRGCILDFVNYPLNNRWWLEDEFKKISEMTTEEEKLKRLETIRNWENPGKDSYYDNVSDIQNSPRVLTTSYDACDVAWWDDGYSRARLSSQLFQTEPVLEYENLNFNRRYLLRISGFGDALVRTDGERLEPILYNKGIGEFKEFIIPKHITQDGKMRLTFDRPEESDLNWRQFSHISDVWLIKR